MALKAAEVRLLDAIVRRAPARFDEIFLPFFVTEAIEGRYGACTTYSRIVAEVFTESGIPAEVRPVYIETANRLYLDYRAGRISLEEAKRLGARIQVWGDIKEGQNYQHAVCFIPSSDVIIDLAMQPRASKLVPCHPYWVEGSRFPWWLVKFEFKTYPLEYRVYETRPEEVGKAKEFVRDTVRRFR